MKKSNLNLKEATTIIALYDLSNTTHDHSLEKLCLECKIIGDKCMEFEARYETPWSNLTDEAKGYFQGFKDGATKRILG